MKASEQPTLPDLAVLYDEDFFRWTERAAELLRAGRFDELDAEHVAQEIEDMGKRSKRGLIIPPLLQARPAAGRNSSCCLPAATLARARAAHKPVRVASGWRVRL